MFEMAPELITVLMFVGLLAGLFLGQPLAFVLGGLATIFGVLGWGYGSLSLFISRINGLMEDYTLVAIPLFILMAQLMSKSGVAEGLFKTVQLLFGPVRGGIAVAVVIVSTLLAACTGITGAACVTMGVLGLPIMLKNGYDKKLATGCIAGSSALGILIPPSIMLIVMAEQSGETVGRLFAGAIIPGLILSSLYLTYILYQCWRHPEKGPALPKAERDAVSKKQLGKMLLTSLVPPLILIFGVLGVLFLGIATPTEASASGALFAFILYLAYGRFTKKGFIEVLSESAKTSSMVLIVMVGATCFTGVFMGLGGGDVVQEFILGAGFGKWGTFILMMLICFFLGMFLDWIAIVMITFPIFLPIAKSLGFDTLWFVVAMAVMLQDSFCTPPFGYNLFYLKGCAPPEIKTKHIYLGAIPFWELMELGLVIVCIFPQTVTWLPSILIK